LNFHVSDDNYDENKRYNHDVRNECDVTKEQIVENTQNPMDLVMF